jgi:hypothetical protein
MFVPHGRSLGLSLGQDSLDFSLGGLVNLTDQPLGFGFQSV